MSDEQPRRRRMSRHVSLVLLGSLPGLAGCGGHAHAPRAEEMEEVEDVEEQPPPDGPAHVLGGPFIAWWALTHPPIITHRMVPRSAVAGGGYTRTPTGGYRRHYYGGRSGFLFGGSSGYRPGPSIGSSSGHSSPVSRGGFGSTGHSSVGG